MKKLKKALSITLALTLTLVLALPAASAADVEDSPYIKFSNKPNSYGQFTTYPYPDSPDVKIYFPFFVFPDDTTYTLTAALDGYDAIISYLVYEVYNAVGAWGGGYLDMLDDGLEIGGVYPIAKGELCCWSVSSFDETSDEWNTIEELYFCTQSTFDNWVSDGAVVSFTTDTTGQPTTPTEPEQPTEPSNPTTPSTPVPEKVVLSPQKLTVDGKDIECEKYNIDGSNYFKLRDLAQLLNGTGSQFAVGYDEATSTVTITTGEAYVSTGTELVTGVDNSAIAQPSNQTILINGVAHGDLTVYNIGGSNFFQLRELGNILGFDVGYDVNTDTAIVTSK